MPSPTIGQQFVELLATYCDLRERLGSAKVHSGSDTFYHYELVGKAHADLVAFIDSKLAVTIEE